VNTRDRQIREATDLQALVESYGVKLRRCAPNTVIGRCPFHTDKSPSLRINLPGHAYPERWKCWSGCGAGDAVDFLIKIEGISKFEAVKRLAATAGISLSEDETPEQRKSRIRKQKQDAIDRPRALRYFRDRWKYWRGALNRAMRDGPPEYNSNEYRWADTYGAMMRLCEKLAGTEAGLEAFRRIHGRAANYKAGREPLFRSWKSG
jgi:hypothetical protein